MPAIPTSVVIGAQLLQSFAVGDSIEARFRNVLAHLDEGCWMTTTDDERFRAAVGGVMLSYPPDSAEVDRIAAEMVSIQRVSTLLQAATLGMTVDLPEPEEQAPIGLLGLWHERLRK